MKTNKVILTTVIATFMLLPLLNSAGGLPIGAALSSISTESVPFSATKKTRFPKNSSAVDNSNNAIPDKLYNDLQCTQYTKPNAEQQGCLFRKFAIPGSSNMLVAVAFGGVTDWRTTVLCVVTPTGSVISTLEAYVDYFPYVAVKQFRITAQNKIIISKIVPATSTPIMFENFTSFVGQRVDVTYAINSQGKFVQISSQTFPSKTYTRSYLENENINIWDDNSSVVPGYQPGGGG
ncbi:MAG: hypothetical protein LBG47_02915 [Prevotellaceae bacterium]|jgi:hypothetical protein|nr:hypothetical protein [Prevotellaceae bacterium]